VGRRRRVTGLRRSGVPLGVKQLSGRECREG
jgi:hypothetical protein